MNDKAAKKLSPSSASFGMTYLSPDAMRDARKFMSADQKGVRDEIGFLIVHQRYADRFFPGTSVLHTRLRYVLFVPWLYRDEYMKPAPPNAVIVIEKYPFE
jgi:hypothetical protein